MNSRRILFALLSGFAAFGLLSCGKETEGGDVLAQAPSNGVPTVFQCAFEVPEAGAVGTKVSILDGEGQQRIPIWETGDKIKIFYKDPSLGVMASVEGTANTSGVETTFTAVLPQGVSAFYAVYPSTLTSSVDEDGNFSVKMKTGSEDEATFSQACICIAKSGPEKQFRFRNLCAILKFSVQDKGSILQVCGIGAAPVDGTISASLGADGSVIYAQDPYSETEYSRQLKKIGADNTTCYIPILPGAMAGGIAINHLATYTAPAAFAQVPIAFERSHI